MSDTPRGWLSWFVRTAGVVAVALAVATCGDSDSPSPTHTDGANNNGPSNNNTGSGNNNASNNNNSSNNNASNNNSSNNNASNNNSSNNNNSMNAWPIERVTVGAGGVESDDDTNMITVAQDGRFVAFRSSATTISTIVPTNSIGIFVRDRINDTTELANLNNSNEVMGALQTLAISDDGTRVLFRSTYRSFDGDASTRQGVFVRDLTSAATVIASLTDDEDRINGNTSDAQMSGDGRYVAFVSDGLNLPVTNGRAQLYLRDLVDDTTTFVSGTVMEPANRAASGPDLSDDGQRVVFLTAATNLAAGASGTQAYVFDLNDGSLTPVSVNDQGDFGDSSSQAPAISGDGRYVAFRSTSSNLVAGVTDGGPYLYLRDTQLGTTIVASVDTAGQPVRLTADVGISDDGRYIAFATAENAAPDDMDSQTDIYRFDRMTGTSERISFTSMKMDPDAACRNAALSGSGETVGFLTPSSMMVPEQTTNLLNEGYVVDVP